MFQALSDLKVLDVGHYVAGPFCAKLLADYGAEVVKIERPGEGDGARRLGPFPDHVPHPEKSRLFLHLNTNKRGITLDIKTAEGAAIFKRLVARADIVVENFAPRVMRSLELDYPNLEKENPRLVMTSISNFGQTGPYRDLLATEITSLAMGVHMFGEGEPGREPLRFPGHKTQYLAGSHAAAVTLGTVFGSRLSGEGQHVDVSIQECQTAPPEGGGNLMAYDFSGTEEPRQGYRREGVYPLGIYPCNDGHIYIYGVVGFFWPRFAAWMGMPELLEDPRFATPLARREHHGDFEAILIPWLMERTRDDAFHSAQAHRIPVTPVYTVDEQVLDPQLNARDFFTEIDHPVAGRAAYAGLPFKLPETLSLPQRPAPLLGEHNRLVYHEWLGLGDEDLDGLHERKVI